MSDVLGGGQLREARLRAGWTRRADFAERVGVKARTLEGWESASGHVPPGKIDLVRRVLDERRPDPLAGYSDARLVAEINAMVAELARRLDRHADAGNETVTGSGTFQDDQVDGDTYSGSPALGSARGDNEKPGPRRIRGRGTRA